MAKEPEVVKFKVQTYQSDVKVIGNADKKIEEQEGDPTPMGKAEVRELIQDQTFETNFLNLTREVADFNKQKRTILLTFPPGFYRLNYKRIIKAEDE